jgi:signal transduction histidine kinase
MEKIKRSRPLKNCFDEYFVLSKERYQQYASLSSQGMWCLMLHKPMPLNVSRIKRIEWLMDNLFMEECNQVYSDTMGFSSPADITGLFIREFPDFEFNSTKEDLYNFITNGYCLEKSEIKVNIKGEMRYFSHSNTGYIENGFLIRIFGCQRDITEQVIAFRHSRELAMALQQYDKMRSLGEFACKIAHDFNNALTPVLGMARILADDPFFEDNYNKEISVINRSVLHAQDLVKQILAFSRSEKHLALIALDLQKELKKIISFSSSTMPSNIKLSSFFKNISGRVMVNSVKLHQVISNLLANSCHAIGSKKGQIKIILTEISSKDARIYKVKNSLKNTPVSDIASYARITISDTGCGISSENLPKIFEPYFTTRSGDKGTGLGMAIVYSIIKEHAGDITVTSTPNKGTQVNIFLPVCCADN